MGRASRRKVDLRGRPVCLRCDRRFDPADLYPNGWNKGAKPGPRPPRRAVWCQRCVSTALVRGAVDGVYDPAEMAAALDALLVEYQDEVAS